MIDFVAQQRDTIENVIKVLKSYDDIECIFIMGSHVNADASSFSDIDIAFVFSTPERPQREAIFRDISNLHPTLSTLWLFNKQGLFLYENGVRLDLDFLIADDLEGWNLAGVDIIYDPQNKYRNNASYMQEETDEAPRPYWRDDDGDMIDWFFWMFRQAYCYIRRGETDEKRHFDKLYNAQQTLNGIRIKLIEMRIFLHGKWDYMSQIDQSFASKMAESFSDFQPVNMKLASRTLFDLYIATARDYCEETKRDFPEDKVKTMLTLFDTFDRASK